MRKARERVPVKCAAELETGERQLRYSDLDILRGIFDEIRVKEFQIFSRLDGVLKTPKTIGFFHLIDEWLLARMPWLGRLARLVVVELRRGLCPSGGGIGACP